MLSQTTSTPCFRLRAEIEGRTAFFSLATGENRLGSSSVNHIVIPVPEVSRRHARLLVDGSELALEDLASKNGTFVNGARIERSSLTPGDRLGIGPINMVIEEIESADVELALVLTQDHEIREKSTSSVVPTRSTRLLRASDDPLPLIQRLLVHGAPPEGDLSAALTLLREELNAQNALVIEWVAARQPVVVASSGDLPAGPLRQVLRQIEPPSEEESLASPECETGRLSDPESVAFATLRRGSAAPLGLLLWNVAETRPLRPALLRCLIWLLYRLRPDDSQRSPRQAPTEDRLIFPQGFVPGRSPAMRRLYDEMRPLLNSDLPVLIEGETGVGKEYIARILHRSSNRRRGPFIAINCAAIPADLLEAEVFGIGEGVATGVRGRKGKFQLAQGGTLFLDEIGEMALELQAKLLRALQEKEVHPVGGQVTTIDVRVLAATNLDLLARVEQQGFRRDLYYRVAGFVLRVPSLRERGEDLPLLIEHFLRLFTSAAGKSIRGVTVKALTLLTRYRWPGNIRELENEIQRLVHSCPDGHFIDSATLATHLRFEEEETSTPPETLRLAPHLEATERRLIRQALKETGGSQRKTAELLGVSRNGLVQKIKRLGLEIPGAENEPGSDDEPPRLTD